MKSLKQYLIEALNEAKENKLGNNPIKKGQVVKVKHPIDDGKELTVKYVGPHESSRYFYCIDDTDRMKAFKVEDVIEVLPLEKKPRKASVEKVKAQKSKIADLEAQLASMMSDMENDPAVLKELETGGGNATDKYGVSIDRLQTKINAEYDRLRKMQESLEDDESLMNESKDEFVRIKLKGLDGAEELEKSIRKIGERDGVYVDEANEGVKIKINNESNVDSIIELLTEFCNSYSKKEEHEDLIKGLYDAISKIENVLNAEDNEHKEDQNKDDSKKEEE